MGVEFTTNLKGLNFLKIRGKEIQLSDDDCECIVKQITEKLGINSDECSCCDEREREVPAYKEDMLSR